MPTYQYACTNPDCGSEFELVQSFTDQAASACPVCDGTVRKRYGSVGVVFKGSGFYRTDSRAGDKTSAKSSDSTSKSESTTPSSDKAAAKSDSSSSTTSSPTKAAATA
jgi:putative FmdB family regulatory protein